MHNSNNMKQEKWISYQARSFDLNKAKQKKLRKNYNNTSTFQQ